MRMGGLKDHVTKQIMLGEIGVSDLRVEDRTEALFISVQSRNGESFCWIDPIIRNAQTSEVFLLESQKLEDVAGRFGKLFQ